MGNLFVKLRINYGVSFQSKWRYADPAVWSGGPTNLGRYREYAVLRISLC